jgi:hypothetical protein
MSENNKMNEFELVLSMFNDSPESKLRLEALKRQLALHENDAQWLYIAAMENYQRLYEAVPRYIHQAASAERERMQTEIGLIIAQANSTMTKAAEEAAGVASGAAEAAASKLIENIEQAVNKRAVAAVWRQRSAAMAGALGLAAGAAAFAGILTTPTPDWISAAYHGNNSAIMRMIAAMWNAPAGWVITLALVGVFCAYWIEYTAAKLSAHINNERA